MKKSLFGYGLTTKALAKSGGWDIYDDNFEICSVDEFGNNLLNPAKFDPNLSELEIPSPGFPPHHNLIKSAKNLISEYDYFEPVMPKSIWISGTNGKTTTTKMTQWLLEPHGSVMGGNVGTPLANLDKKAKIWILETSSFTLHYTNHAKPNIYFLLPITPDHLSWHGSMSEYEKAKLKPLSMMSEGNIAIVPEIYAHRASAAKVVGYKDEFDLAAKFDIDIQKINFKTPFLMDAVFALCAAKLIFGYANYDLLNKFVIEAHKLEEFKDAYLRLWVDDTKATNLDATLQALKRYKDKKIHIILGGDDKGVDLNSVFEALKPLTVVIYAIGSNTDKLVDLSAKFDIKCVKCEFLEVAVKNISQNMSKDKNSNEIALLSPACASLDQFKSYAQRGDLFKKYVKEL
ncbi:UDP-N-acetylmuramoyl-L-alanine:D-glutamate ligase [Campylobacter iguaniorum]|uniref:UDP-N-acetylmuramoylalanine--D-glutamate ligase n=1 Tax=Campylobacter iguaniorum TaxID=1244531 RepID=A0A076FB06_9BACT|nr:UDP-N-acetylmuramoyl-L-alanine--D-glutamate ligase [Campylobacter iguaniorum]AII15191.1 UDP-N-acetylmuramoyl-L-alanine:D-glutamate ligase [Campylobacter iguaniorum]